MRERKSWPRTLWKMEITMLAILFALLLAQDCPDGVVCPRKAPTLASPAKTEANPNKSPAKRERSAVTKRGESHLPPVASKLRPFARKACHRPSRTRGPFLPGRIRFAPQSRWR